MEQRFSPVDNPVKIDQIGHFSRLLFLIILLVFCGDVINMIYNIFSYFITSFCLIPNRVFCINKNQINLPLLLCPQQNCLYHWEFLWLTLGGGGGGFLGGIFVASYLKFLIESFILPRFFTRTCLRLSVMVSLKSVMSFVCDWLTVTDVPSHQIGVKNL